MYVLRKKYVAVSYTHLDVYKRQVTTDEQSGQTIVSGMGELHLDMIIDRLKREFKVECNQVKPQVNYKEAITKTVELREVYKKQSGGRGKFADKMCIRDSVRTCWVSVLTTLLVR